MLSIYTTFLTLYALTPQTKEKMDFNPFWKVYVSITVLVSAVSFISLNAKRMFEKIKDFKLKENVTVMPISSTHG